MNAINILTGVMLGELLEPFTLVLLLIAVVIFFQL